MVKFFQKLICEKIKEFNSDRFARLVQDLKPNDGSFWKFCKKYSKKTDQLPSVIFDSYGKA